MKLENSYFGTLFPGCNIIDISPINFIDVRNLFINHEYSQVQVLSLNEICAVLKKDPTKNILCCYNDINKINRKRILRYFKKNGVSKKQLYF